MPTPDHLILHELIPDPDTVRRRLAVVLTEADLLRSQLRVSERLTRERKRLRRQRPEEVRHAG
jgi:precorrin-6B methylase 1